MLKKEQISPIMPLAAMLTERGVKLEVISGSPIGNLTMASNTISATGDVEETLQAVASPVDTGRKDSEGAPIRLPSEHGYVKKRVVECVAAGVTQMKDDARNIVIPAINSTRDAIDAELELCSTARKIIPEVDVYNYDPIWSSALTDGIEYQYAKVDMVGMPSTALPTLTEDQLRALVDTGSQEIHDFILREDKECPGHLNAIWQIWFQGQPVSDSDDFKFLSRMLKGTEIGRVLVAGQPIDSVDARTGYDAVVTAFLIASALYDNPISGVDWGMDASSYNLTMSAFKAHFGKVIGRIHHARGVGFEKKTLVINMPVTNNWRLGEGTSNILLNGDVYSWYLDAGGSIEAILGNVFTERTVDGRTILNLKPKFEADYDNVTNTYAGLQVSNRHAKIMQTLTVTVIKHIQGIDQAFWDDRLSCGMSKLDIIKDMQRYLASGVPIGTSDNLDHAITTIYTSFVYGNLNTDQFINAMNNYPNQDLSPKVIAAHVLMDMIIKSLMNDVYYNSQSL